MRTYIHSKDLAQKLATKESLTDGNSEMVRLLYNFEKIFLQTH